MPLPNSQMSVAAAAVAAADGAAAEPPISAPVEVDAAAAAAVLEPNSRREAANAVQASGANAGASPLPPPASHESRFEPTPATEVDAAARGAAAAGAAFTDSTAAAGAAAAGASLFAAGAAASEGVETTARGASVTASLAEPALPAEGSATVGASLLRRGLAAAEEDVPLRTPLDASLDEVLSLEAPPRPPRRAGDDLVAAEDPLVAWSLVEPAEPVVSAYAIGITLIAEPMPSATARAPTRPMYLE